MRRPPPAVWILAPLILASLYYFGHAWFSGTPGVAQLPPSDTILTWRFKNTAALNNLFPGPRGPTQPLPVSLMARDRNVPRLHGVDANGPIHWLLVPSRGRPDASLVIFPLDDAEAFEAEFNDLKKIEQGYIRHAQYLAIHGGRWAAVSHQLDAVRRVGTGGISIEPGDEDFAVAAHVPELVDLAMKSARQLPWKPLLESLGVDIDAIAAAAVESLRATEVLIPGTERVRRIADAWSTARMWGWQEQGRLRVELRPNASSRSYVDKAMKSLHEAPSPTGRVPPAPADAKLWIYVPDAAARAVLSMALYACGVEFPQITTADGKKTVSLETLTKTSPGDDGLLIWGERQSGDAVYALTMGVATPSLGPLRDTLGEIPEAGASMKLPRGAAPLTIIDTGRDRTSPRGTIEHDTVGDLEVVTYGESAKKALSRFRTHMATGSQFTPPDGPEGMRLIAAFYMDRGRAEKILGKGIQDGGMFSVLSGGAIRGAIWTDGKVLRLEATVVGRTP